ncbi:MAG: prepilin-type N-terminal cleavage/methylation domain-containing protein [Desulfosporosinus sp.]|nr:prepilin-type N-terminal cleavage/methylation domain-containing protein [Desulfosporosinus sp.]
MGRKRTKGFTIVELIIVIAIIAILATVILPKYFKLTDGARESVALSDTKSIWVIIQSEYSQYGNWPVPTIQDINGNSQSTITLHDGTVYTFNGLITLKTPYDGSFTYKKSIGTENNNLITVECDGLGNVTEDNN